MHTLGKLVKSLRIASAFSEQDLATRVGVSKSTISLWESDKDLPSRENFVALENIYPTHREILRALWLYSDAPDIAPEQVRHTVTTALWQKIEKIKNHRYSDSQLTGIEEWINSRKYASEACYYGTIHLLVVDYLSKLRELAKMNSKLITTKSKYNAFLMSYLLGATDVCPIEWGDVCPKCKSRIIEHQCIDRTHRLEKCTSCNHIYLSQLCMPIDGNIGLFSSYRIAIDTPKDFIKIASNLAVSYFSPVTELRKKVYEINGEMYVELFFCSGEKTTYYDSIDDVPTIIKTDRVIDKECPIIVFHEHKINQLVSEELPKGMPDLCDVYGIENITRAANSMRKQLPMDLQADVESVTTLSQLINIVIVTEQLESSNKKAINSDEVKKLKTLMSIDNWTCLPFTQEDYAEWKRKDRKLYPEHWSDDDIVIRHYGTEYSRLFRQYGGHYSTGEYSDIIFRLLLKAFFFAD